MRSVSKWVAIVFSLVAIAFGSVQAMSTPERRNLSNDTTAFRDQLDQARQSLGLGSQGEGKKTHLAQWFNWPNWNNWPNWANWLNW